MDQDTSCPLLNQKFCITVPKRQAGAAAWGDLWGQSQLEPSQAMTPFLVTHVTGQQDLGKTLTQTHAEPGSTRKTNTIY